MSKLKQIQAPISKDLQEFEIHFRDYMKSKVPLLDKIMYYIVQRKGKQLRPMFVFLSAKLCGEVTKSTHIAASMVELLHTASLVHDDLVDDSFQRRGFFSINALWKNKIAVLVGDYLFSKGMLVTLDNHEYRILHIFSTAVKEIIEGELLQIEKARRLDIQEDIYFDIIRQKTASLIAASCSAGAASVTDSEEMIEHMRLFGESIGIAYQIKDDLMDYGTADIGKPTAIDIQEKKMTLPLIYALQQGSKKQRRYHINTVKNHNKNKKRIAELIQFVKDMDGISYAEEKMQHYFSEAQGYLDRFEKTEVKDAMSQLIEYVIERSK